MTKTHKELMTRGTGEMLGGEEERRLRKDEEWKEEGRVKVMAWRGQWKLGLSSK